MGHGPHKRDLPTANVASLDKAARDLHKVGRNPYGRKGTKRTHDSQEGQEEPQTQPNTQPHTLHTHPTYTHSANTLT